MRKAPEQWAGTLFGARNYVSKLSHEEPRVVIVLLHDAQGKTIGKDTLPSWAIALDNRYPKQLAGYIVPPEPDSIKWTGPTSFRLDRSDMFVTVIVAPHRIKDTQFVRKLLLGAGFGIPGDYYWVRDGAPRTVVVGQLEEDGKMDRRVNHELVKLFAQLHGDVDLPEWKGGADHASR